MSLKNARGKAEEEVLPILEELIKLKRKVEKRKSRISAFPASGAPSKQLVLRFNINIIRGEVKSDIVLSECIVIINRRCIIEGKLKTSLPRAPARRHRYLYLGSRIQE